MLLLEGRLQNERTKEESKVFSSGKEEENRWRKKRASLWFLVAVEVWEVGRVEGGLSSRLSASSAAFDPRNAGTESV